MKTMIQTLMVGLLLAGTLTACSKKSSLEAASNTPAADGGDQNNGQGDDNGGGGSNNNANIDQVDIDGYISSGDYESLKGVTFDKTRGELVLTLPLGLDLTVPAISGGLAKYPDIIFQTSKGSDGRTYLVARVPVKYFLRGVNGIKPTRLPNGDPLPGVPAGELPSLGFKMNVADGRKVYLYLGVEVVALYVESSMLKCPDSFPICFSSIPIPMYNKDRTKQIGQFALVLGKNKQKGGFYMSTQIPPSVAKILDEYFMN